MSPEPFKDILPKAGLHCIPIRRGNTPVSNAINPTMDDDKIDAVIILIFIVLMTMLGVMYAAFLHKAIFQ